jgi:gamma-glutamylcyclotransferase (GGCT)/AIG2-like uncharacterized protein YtfP
MQKEQLTVKVFVYGTLKRNNTRAGVLDGYAVRWVRAAILGFDIYDLGHFPCILPSESGNGQVFGELVECNDPLKVVRQLDAIEGYHPNRDPKRCMYLRKKVDVIELGTGKKHKAFAYVWAKPERLGESSYYSKRKVKSGNWHRADERISVGKVLNTYA